MKTSKLTLLTIVAMVTLATLTIEPACAAGPSLRSMLANSRAQKYRADISRLRRDSVSSSLRLKSLRSSAESASREAYRAKLRSFGSR